MENASLKNHSPCEGFPLSGKRVQLIYIWIEIFQNIKANLFCTKMKINSRGSIFVGLECWMCDQFPSYSCLLGEMLLACWFLWWGMVLSIFAETFRLCLHFFFFSRRSLLVIIVLVWLSYCTNFMFPFDISQDSRSPSFFLPLVNLCLSFVDLHLLFRYLFLVIKIVSLQASSLLIHKAIWKERSLLILKLWCCVSKQL
jgi:hypothetical protein